MTRQILCIFSWSFCLNHPLTWRLGSNETKTILHPNASFSSLVYHHHILKVTEGFIIDSYLWLIDGHSISPSRWFPLSLRPQNPPARWLSITLMWNLGWLPQLQKQDSPIQGLSPIIWLPFASFLMARVWNPEEPSVLEVVIFKKDSSSRRDKPDRP